MADFPHLNDTTFPNLDNVNVYAYKNDFDYTRFVANTEIHLCNVRWNGDYANVVEFGSDDARDSWFDSLSDTETVTINTPQKLRADGTVKVPVPFDVACMYNYCYIDIPVITGNDDMVPYEKIDGYRRWFFFVNDFTYSATNTTILTLQLDVWTQYKNQVGISYMMLERGHAPVAASNVDDYLSDPIANNRYLLSPDVNYGEGTIERDAKFVPFGNGEKLLCIATTCSPKQMRAMKLCKEGKDYFGNPTFHDDPDYPDSTGRWGYRYVVENYGWENGKSYEGISAPADNAISSDGRIANNLYVIAVAYSDADAFVKFLLSYAPGYLRTIRAVYMVPRDLANLAESFSFHNFTVYVCEGAQGSLADIRLDKSMFGFDRRYERFAKLYTSPYSELEITDNNGKSVTVKIEETSTLEVRYVTAYAFPFLRMRAFVDGIGGVGHESYKWVDLRGTHDCEISNSDWYKCCFDFSIPTFSLWADGETEYMTSYYNRTLKNGRAQALTTYHNNVRGSNDSYHAALDESETARNNAVATANMLLTNARNSAATLESDNANLRAEASAITAHNNASATNLAKHANDYHISATNTVNEMGSETATAQIGAAIATTRAENDATTSLANNNAIATGAQGVISAGGSIAGAVAASGAGDKQGLVNGIAGAATSILSAGVSAAQLVSNASVATNANQAVTDASTHATSQCASAAQQKNTAMRSADNLKLTQDNNAIVQCNNSNTESANARNAANAANDAANIRKNASNANSTSISNANATRDTRKQNARYNRNASVIASQDVLRNAQNTAKYTLLDARNSAPVAHGEHAGDATPDYMRNRGLQIKVRTQQDSAIACAASQFARFGYNLGMVWNSCERLQVMKHFTYWKASDAWVYDIGNTNNSTQLAISDILRNGVTVWSDPNEIGAVNVYDN